MVTYKFVELSVVTDESIEECVNDWVGIRFVVSDASRRPQMAFVSFIRDVGENVASEPPRSSNPRKDK
jgi:hypothetical protein